MQQRLLIIALLSHFTAKSFDHKHVDHCSLSDTQHFLNTEHLFDYGSELPYIQKNSSYIPIRVGREPVLLLMLR